VENAGVLTASGLIAGEALTGLVVAACRFFEWPVTAGPDKTPGLPALLPQSWMTDLAGLAILALLGLVMVRTPLANAGRPEDPAPPTAIM